MTKLQPVRLADIEAKVIHHTPTALLLDFGGAEPAWFPKSLVEDNRDGSFTMPEWLAIKKGAA